MKSLKLFENHSAYEAAKESLVLPNVSFCVRQNEVHYNKRIDPYNGHEYVDLGLPNGTKWATMNIGATSETDYGNYYQYGKGSAQYTATSGDSYYDGTEKPLSLSADTAAQVWGGSWHMPTYDQLNELTANTTSEWTTIDGVNGYKFTSTNGNYIFFPAAGRWNDDVQTDIATKGFYWGSYPASTANGYDLEFYDGRMRISYIYRGFGLPVRGVVD